MQCLQYIFYSLLKLQKHLVYVKGHQNNPQTPRILTRRDHGPGFEIHGSATVLDLEARIIFLSR